MKTRLVVVLGMHRSGTSLITRSLATLGASFGDNLIPAAKDNDKGFWEDNDIVAFNDELLAACGMKWYSTEEWTIEKIQPDSLKNYQERAIAILRKKLKSTSVFALKDPRISKLFGFWSSIFDLVDNNTMYILAVRSPRSIAESLVKRNNFASYHAYMLWTDYVLTTLTHLKGKKFIKVEYERMIDNSFTEILRIAEFLDLDIEKKELENFINHYVETGLEHTHFSYEETDRCNSLPLLCKEIYAYLVSKEFKAISLSEKQHYQLIEKWKNLKSNLIECQSFNQLVEEYPAARDEIYKSKYEAEQAKALAQKLLTDIDRIYSSRSWKLIAKAQRIKDMLSRR